MRLFTLAILASTAFAAAGQDDAVVKALKEDLKNLEGKWAQLSVQADGKQPAEEKDSRVTLTITGNKWIERSVGVADDGGFYTFKINPAKKPKELDLTDKIDDQGKTQTFPGIYMLEGNTLTIAVPYPFEGNVANIEKRPTGFRTKPGDDFVVIVYKRVK